MCNRKKVICDNNVWFQINADENPVTLNHKDHYYVGTAINVIEFITDEHKYKTEAGRIKLNNAIQAMHNNCSEFILEDPVVYSAIRLSTAQKPHSLESETKLIYEKLIMYSENRIPKLHGPTIESIHKYESDFKEGTTKMAIRYNELAEKHKSEEKEKLEKIQSLSQEWFYESMSKVMQQEIKLEDSQDIKGLDTFLRSYSLALHRIDETKGPKSNSVFDLLQLLYLVNGEIDIFWTLDGQISKRINYLDNMFGTDDKSFIKNDHR
jgi:hypothetical protein